MKAGESLTANPAPQTRIIIIIIIIIIIVVVVVVVAAAVVVIPMLCQMQRTVYFMSLLQGLQNFDRNIYIYILILSEIFD
jgi:hypothetical protein